MVISTTVDEEGHSAAALDATESSVRIHGADHRVY
jgi:hypothetical protein